MLDWFLETGLYLLGIALIPGVGLLLVYRGLWGDRSRGRVRCPKCWYDMRGTVPKLECPECGHDAEQERRLHRHNRRWGRIVLGVLLVLLLAYPLTIVGGWYREQSAIQKLTKRGHVAAIRLRIGPKWLVGRLPEEAGQFFDRVKSVWLSGLGTDADVAECGKLSQLQHLSLSGTQLTDVGLAHLKELPQLRSLSLYNMRVTDAGLVHLKGLSQLQKLNLWGTSVTDVALVHLKGLSQLQSLSLGSAQVTDAGLVHLKGLSQLQELNLAGTSVTDAGVAALKQALPQLAITKWLYTELR